MLKSTQHHEKLAYCLKVRLYGVSLAEYAMAGGIILTISTAGLLLLGKSLKDNVDNFGNSLAKPGTTNIAQLPLSKPIVDRNVSIDTPAAGNSSAFSRTITLTLKNGNQITLPDYPDNIKKSILTLGANGTTTKLLSTLEQLTEELLASGEITEDQASTLRDLSNRGHEIANRQKWIEEYLTKGDNERPQPGEPIVYEGKTYHDFGNFAQSFDIFNQGKLSDTQQAFADAYQQALNASALQDPAVKALVDSLVQDIKNVADTFAEGTHRFVNNPEQIPTYDSILEFSASKQTHQSSAQICEVDERKDTGVRCL